MLETRVHAWERLDREHEVRYEGPVHGAKVLQLLVLQRTGGYGLDE